MFVFPAESRGQAGLALETYIKNYGKPQIIIHDNASEFVDGDFAQICTTQPQHHPTKEYTI